jgi:putative transposase
VLAFIPIKTPKTTVTKKLNRLTAIPSFTTNNQNATIAIEDGNIKIPKLKTRIRIKLHRPFTGLIKSCTLSKTPSGKYVASVLVETDIAPPLPKTENKIGVDLGLKDFASTSDGEVIANPKHLRKSEKRLAKLQKDLSRKKKRSNSRNKARINVAKLHEKIANQRKDFLHQTSTKMINDNQVIVMEDLRVKNMMQNHKLAKAISEVSVTPEKTRCDPSLITLSTIMSMFHLKKDPL